MSIDSLSPILEPSSVTISHEHELANRWLRRPSPGPQAVGGRRSRRLAIRSLRAELAMAEDTLFAAARNFQAGGGAAAFQTWRRCIYRECARLWPQWWTSSSVGEMVYFFYSSTHSV